jgi:hypothetical protein
MHGEIRYVYKILVGSLERGGHLRLLEVYEVSLSNFINYAASCLAGL